MNRFLLDHLPDTLLLAAADSSDAAAAMMRRPAETGWEHLAENILFFVVDVGIVILALAFIMCLWRVVSGPTLIDRGLAGDTIAMQVVGFTILLTIRAQTLMYFDAVIIISILGFASTIAVAQFVGRRGLA
ncbi:MAG: monovalent cation/H+ antiporter complex subunit F [Planctomycetota bacterium]|nr:monovalent cation/H+ antiporter complex subunit F [Planctomycetota bacterium]